MLPSTVSQAASIPQRHNHRKIASWQMISSRGRVRPRGRARREGSNGAAGRSRQRILAGRPRAGGNRGPAKTILGRGGTAAATGAARRTGQGSDDLFGAGTILCRDRGTAPGNVLRFVGHEMPQPGGGGTAHMPGRLYGRIPYRDEWLALPAVPERRCRLAVRLRGDERRDALSRHVRRSLSLRLRQNRGTRICYRSEGRGARHVRGRDAGANPLRHSARTTSTQTGDL